MWHGSASAACCKVLNIGSRATARMKKPIITHQHSQQKHGMHACHPNLQDNHQLLINVRVLLR
jgi:hypothetical protein